MQTIRQQSRRIGISGLEQILNILHDPVQKILYRIQILSSVQINISVIPVIPVSNVLTFYVFFTMLFNGGLVPTYINYVNIFHIKDTFWGLLLPGLVTNGFNVLLMKSYFTSSIPDEIVEAAYIDGASETLAGSSFLEIA